MSQKIDAIRGYLQAELPGRFVAYRFEDDLHKFKISGDTPTLWLYVSQEGVDDRDSIITINALRIEGVIDAFKNAGEPLHIFLGERAYQVDETFPEKGWDAGWGRVPANR